MDAEALLDWNDGAARSAREDRERLEGSERAAHYTAMQAREEAHLWRQRYEAPFREQILSGLASAIVREAGPEIMKDLMPVITEMLRRSKVSVRKTWGAGAAFDQKVSVHHFEIPAYRFAHTALI